MTMNKDTRAARIREVVLELLSDGKVHSTREIMECTVAKGLITDRNTDVVYNALFHMKRKGLIMSGPEKAQYISGCVDRVQNNKMQDCTNKNNVLKESKVVVSTINLDPQKYSLLQPMPGRYSRMTLMVKENGELRMNGTLMKKIRERNIEIFISKDLRNIVLNPSGTNTHKFTKAGTTKNREIVSMLKRVKIKLPVFYVVTWNDSIGAWEGILDISEKV